ncbi:c-type heme family protein [Winogradskyella sp. PC D3.3]
MKNTIILIVLALYFTSCNSNKPETSAYGKVDKPTLISEHPGKKLMETNCYVCHNPTATQTDRIGPPMIAIKKHYINSETSKEDFIASMQAWIKNPNAEDAKMYGAVKRFGVMPKQAFAEKTIEQIADYMYDYNIEQPEWFEEHFNQESGKGMGMGNGQAKKQGMQQAQTNFEDLSYGERGLKYALTTKAVLGKNLMGTIQKKGVLEALTFCNERAYPLTDSMSVVHNAVIRRVSDKPRNPKNKANLEELDYINIFKKVIANNEEASPIVKEMDTKVKVYYPITTNAMCLQCHGKPNETLNETTLTRIKSLYPMDKAIGYNINEVRGIWSITYDK